MEPPSTLLASIFHNILVGLLFDDNESCDSIGDCVKTTNHS